MTSQAIEGACAFAWRNYLLLHSGISENDNRRSALCRYVANLRDTGEDDFDLLQIAAVAYLRKLDELHGNRSARLAADQALAVQPTLVETSHRYVRASRRKNTFEFAPRLLENGVEKELLDTGCRNRIFLEKCALVRDH